MFWHVRVTNGTHELNKNLVTPSSNVLHKKLTVTQLDKN